MLFLVSSLIGEDNELYFTYAVVIKYKAAGHEASYDRSVGDLVSFVCFL